jgi:hypothetical protein
MSYTFVVRVEGSAVGVDSVTGDIPEGKYTVNGHDDERNRSLTVTRFTQAGLIAVQASANASREA